MGVPTANKSSERGEVIDTVGGSSTGSTVSGMVFVAVKPSRSVARTTMSDCPDRSCAGTTVMRQPLVVYTGARPSAGTSPGSRQAAETTSDDGGVLSSVIERNTSLTPSSSISICCPPAIRGAELTITTGTAAETEVIPPVSRSVTRAANDCSPIPAAVQTNW